MEARVSGEGTHSQASGGFHASGLLGLNLDVQDGTRAIGSFEGGENCPGNRLIGVSAFIEILVTVAGDRGGVGGASLTGSAEILTTDTTPVISSPQVRGLTVTLVSFVMKDEGPSV